MSESTKLMLSGLYEMGKAVRDQLSGLNFSELSDSPTTQLVSGFLALNDQGELIWRLPTSGDITYSISGATHITGLLDTPSDYQKGKYLVSTDAGIEYKDITGLSKDLAAAQAIGFTGLSDTPLNYQEGKFLVSSSSGITYTGLNNAAVGVTHITGLLDTPNIYNSGKFLQSTADGVEWADVPAGAGGGGGGSVSCSSGVTDWSGISDISNLYTGVPENIFVEHSDGYYAAQFQNINSAGIVYSLNPTEDKYLTFNNNAQGTFRAGNYTNAGSTQTWVATNLPSQAGSGPSLSGLISLGYSHHGGSCSSSSDGGSSSSSGGGVTIPTSPKILEVSNFSGELPSAIIAADSDGATRDQFPLRLGYISDTHIFYQNTADAYWIQFKNDSSGDYVDNSRFGSTDTRISLQSYIDNGDAIFDANGSSSGGSSSTFASLADTPTGFESGKYLVSTSSGVEWTDAPAGGSSFGGVGSLDVIKNDLDNFAHVVPDAIVVRGTENNWRVLPLQTIDGSGDGSEFVQVYDIYYDIGNSSVYFGFMDTTDGDPAAGQTRAIHSSETSWKLKDYIDSGRAIYCGGSSSVSGSSTFASLTDTPTGFESGKYLVSTSSGVEWTDAPAGGSAGGGVQHFTGLIDTPNTYQPNRFIKVNQASDGLEYTDPLSQSNNINDGESIVSNPTEGKVKRVKAGNNINLSTSQDSLIINANIPAANTSFFGLTDTPSSVVANQFLIGDDQGNLSFSPIDLSSPVGSGFASNFNIVDTKTFYTKIPENIYAINSNASIKEVFKFHKHDAGNSIEYIGSGDKNIVFDDDISGSYSNSNLPAHLDGNNNLSLSGYIDQGRSHYEAARNTGVFNQGLRTVLSAGASEIFNDIQSPKLQNIKGDNNYFTAISYSSQVNNEAQWTVPPALTKNFLDGEVEVDIIWTSEATNGNVKWEIQICPISIGVNIDQASSEPYRAIISSGPTAPNNLCRGTIKFEPTVNEMQSSDFLILKVKRNALAIEDNLNGEAKLIFLSLIEEI